MDLDEKVELVLRRSLRHMERCIALTFRVEFDDWVRELSEKIAGLVEEASHAGTENA